MVSAQSRYKIVVLVAALLLSACGTNQKSTVETTSEYSPNHDGIQSVASTYRHGSTYEEDYINQHLEFLKSAEYAQVRSGKDGGLAGAMADAYDEAGLDTANTIWEAVAFNVDIFSGDKAEVKDGYELVISELMQTTSAEQAFIDSYKNAGLDCTLAFLKAFEECVSSGSSILKEYEQPGQYAASTFAGDLNSIIKDLEELNGVPEEEMKGLYEKALEKFKEKIVVYYPDLKEPKALKTVMEKLGVEKSASDFVKDVFSDAKEGADIIATSYEELIDLYIVRMALSQASDEWFYSWELISGSAMSAGTEESKRFSKAIDAVLEDLYVSRQSAASAYLQAFKEESGKTALRVTESLLIDYWNGCATGHPTLALVKAAAKLGHKLSGALFNMDDVTFNGRMLYRTGTVAPYVEDALDTAARLLKEEKSFATAVLFDELFHIYKETQLKTCDYAIDYYQAMAEAGVNKITVNTAMKHTTDTQLLLVEKVTWQDYECHTQDADCYEGIYLSVDGTKYFWNMTEESFEKENPFRYKADFQVDSSHENKLVSELADGSWKEIASVAGAYGKLWYVGDSFYGIRKKENFYNEIFSVKNNGSGITYYGTGSWAGYDENNSLMVGFTKENGVIAVDVNTGETKTLAEPVSEWKPGALDSNDELVIVTNGYLFYSDLGNNNWDDFVIRVMDLESGEDKEIYRMANLVKTLLGEDYTYCGPTLGEVQETDSYVYLSFGCSGGSAGIFQGAKILRLEKTQLFGASGSGIISDTSSSGASSDTSSTSTRNIAVLCEQKSSEARLKSEQFMAVEEDGKDCVYFNHYDNEESTYVWLSDGAYAEKRYTPLAAVGELVTEYDEITWDENRRSYGMFRTGFYDYETILTADEYANLAKEAGYTGYRLSILQAEVVDGHLYGLLLISSSHPNQVSTDVLEKLVMFDKDLETGEIAVIH